MRLLILLIALAGTLSAATIVIPDDYPLIQQGIEASGQGDLVLVKPGTYAENIDLKGRGITLSSVEGPLLTVIDGSQNGTVVKISTGLGPDEHLRGFTLTNGSGFNFGGEALGGGIFMEGKITPIIEDCVITGCTALRGGGIYFGYASPVIRSNRIELNVAEYGGGIYCGKDSTPVIEKNVIMQNTANPGGNHGGGLCCGEQSNCLIRNNLFQENLAQSGGAVACLATSEATFVGNVFRDNNATWRGGGIYCTGGVSIFVVNNTFCSNESNLGGAISVYSGIVRIYNSILWDDTDEEIFVVSSGYEPLVEHCNIMGGWPGATNISLDPRFVDEVHGDYHLRFTSPCRNNGSSEAPYLQEEDFEGDPRTAYGQTDIGADEFHPHLYTVGWNLPGSLIHIRMTGLPGTSPAGLWLSTSLLDPPMNTMWGEWFLEFPVIGPVLLGSVPVPEGLIDLPVRIPEQPPGPYAVHLQALIGDAFTNPWSIKVE